MIQLLWTPSRSFYISTSSADIYAYLITLCASPQFDSVEVLCYENEGNVDIVVERIGEVSMNQRGGIPSWADH